MLLREFRRAMEQLGVEGEIFATDITEASSALQVADKKFLVPRTGNVKYMPALKKIVHEHDVNLIIPLTDLDLRSLARHREELRESGCEIMIGDEPAVSLCRDKKKFMDFVEKTGLPTIRTFSLGRFRQKPFYPCFIKPLRGSGGIGVAKIESGRQLREHIHVFGQQLLVQDYIPGKEFTIDVYRTRAGETKCIVPRQRLLIRSGEVDQAITVHDEKLIAATKTLSDAIEGLWGVFCCQCRHSDDGTSYFFEINPRFGGGSPLSIHAGADLPLYVLQDALGLEVTAEIGQFTPNTLLMRYSGDFVQTVDEPSKLPGFKSPIVK